MFSQEGRKEPKEGIKGGNKGSSDKGKTKILKRKFKPACWGDKRGKMLSSKMLLNIGQKKPA